MLFPSKSGSRLSNPRMKATERLEGTIILECLERRRLVYGMYRRMEYIAVVGLEICFRSVTHGPTGPSNSIHTMLSRRCFQYCSFLKILSVGRCYYLISLSGSICSEEVYRFLPQLSREPCGYVHCRRAIVDVNYQKKPPWTLIARATAMTDGPLR